MPFVGSTFYRAMNWKADQAAGIKVRADRHDMEDDNLAAGMNTLRGYVDTSDAGKANTIHTHAQADITNLVSDLALKAPLASPTFTGIPAAPTAAALTNTTQLATTAFVTAADTALGATKANTIHTHAQADVTSLVSDLALKAPLASPALTGTPTAPTANVADSSTTIATTAFVKNQLYAPLASPVLTGTPSAPTAAALTSTTQIATTAFVTTADNLKAPIANPTFTGKVMTELGTASLASITLPHGVAPSAPVNGDMWTTTLGLYARINAATKGPFVDAVHTHIQSDITNLVSDLALKAPLASPALTGTPTAPTAAALTNTTQIATTAFVTAADNLKAPNASPTFSGKVSIPPSLTTGAGLNIQQGTAPTTPTNGDFWTVSTGVYVYLNSVTHQLAYLDSPTFTGTVNAAAITATGNITANTHFISSAVSVVLAATGSGQVYLRPNGAAVTTGETTISTAGNMVVAGNMNIAGNVQSTSGAFGSGTSPLYLRPSGTGSTTGQTTIDSAGNMVVVGNITGYQFISTTVNAVLSSSAAGAVYLRPNGPGSTTGQVVVNTSGLVNLISIQATGNYSAAVATVTQGNFNCKAGAVNVYTANTFGIYWTTIAQLYVDATLIGSFAYTSDYRIKKDVADLPSAWDRIKALRPVSYSHAEFQPPASAETKAKMLNQAKEKYAAEKGIPVEEVDPKDMPSKPVPPPLFSNDDNEQWGFLAHEVQSTLIPTAAYGTKDMEDGVQSLNLPAILAATVRGLQEAMTRIETLEAA